MFRVELRRAFANRNMIIALLFGSVISISHFIFEVAFKANIPMETYLEIGGYPPSVFNNWIGLDSGSFQSALLFMSIPILAAYPYGDSFFTDLKSGYIKNIFLRTRKVNYLIAKYATLFLSGGVVVVTPLIINLLLTMSTLPSLPPEVNSGMFYLFESNLWSEIFLSHPYVYVLMYIVINFIFGGLLACLCLFFSFLVSNRFIVILCPFIIHIVLLAFFNRIGVSPYHLLNPAQSIPANPWIIAIEIGVLLILSISLFANEVMKNDIY